MLRKQSSQGFTLIEVALSIALGILIVIAAAIGYNAVRQGAAEREARNRLNAMKAVIEQFAAANRGNVPAVTQLQQMWSARRPEDASMSPWGGIALAGTPTSAGITAKTFTNTSAVDIPSGGAIGYVSFTVTGATGIYDMGADLTVSRRNYAIFYHDKSGQYPYYVTGGDL